MTHLVSTRPRTRLFTRQQEELKIKRRKEEETIDDIIFYEDFSGRRQIISMKQMEEGITNEDFEGGTKITRPRVRMFTRQQDQELNINKRRKVTADDIILYKDLDEGTQIISMKQMEEGRTKIITTNKHKKEEEEDIILYEDLLIFFEDVDGAIETITMKQTEKETIKIITTLNKQKREDVTLYSEDLDLDVRAKIIEKQNSKMNNITKKDHSETLVRDGRWPIFVLPPLLEPVFRCTR